MPSPLLADTILYLLPTGSEARTSLLARKNNPYTIIDHNISDDELVWLNFGHPPKDGRMFVFGSDISTCDIFLGGSGVSGRHFGITLCPTSGIPLLINKSSLGVVVGSKFLKKEASYVLEQGTRVSVGDQMFMVVVPDRKEFQGVYEQKVMERLQHLQVPTGEISLHATPIRSRREIGEYLEIENIGRGSFGDIFLLAHAQTGEVTAAKRFRDKKNHAAVLQEMATLSKLSHEHIVGYHGYLYDEGSLCLLMEYLACGSVLDYELGQMVVLEILRQCLDALAYLHENDIMHRDIKPENIIVQSLSPVNVKLIDFGIAKEGWVANTFCGTPGYIPQEIIRGGDYTNLVDVWALGMTALDLLVGLPGEELRRFNKQQSIDNFDTYFKAITQRRQTLPRPLSDLLAGMLEYDPAYRWCARKCLYKLDEVDQVLRGGLHNHSGGCPPYNKPGRFQPDDQYVQYSPAFKPGRVIHAPRDECRPHDRPDKYQPQDDSDGCCDDRCRYPHHDKVGKYQPKNRPCKCEHQNGRDEYTGRHDQYQYQDDPSIYYNVHYEYRPYGKAGNADLANCFSKINLREAPMARG